MIWAQLCGDLRAALSACASVTLVIVTAERMRDPTSEAEQKAHALLRAWLSPEQAQQYNSQKHFQVIGSDTGTRYRIRHGRMINIDQLDSAGNKVCVWCVVPEGSSKRLYVGAEDRAGDVRNEGLGYCEPKTGLVQYETLLRKNPRQWPYWAASARIRDRVARSP